MPWLLRASHPDYAATPERCPECAGQPSLEFHQCTTCGAMVVARDPLPGEFLTTTLVPVDGERKPLPRRERRTIRLQDGWKRQADGTLAHVHRVIDRAGDRYIETVRRDGVVVHHVDEPLSEHRGHGDARRRS